ncbi:MAG TPA: hypothetical protein VJN18_33225 [Polyangiaceae bacterium]|nr:hypothetical protein [Polyangiaceae bacterium]
MLIERADDVVSVVEIKFTNEPFVITRKYSDELHRKLATFRSQTKLRQAVHLVFVTSYGVAPNAYATELVDAEVRMDALFASSGSRWRQRGGLPGLVQPKLHRYFSYL